MYKIYKKQNYVMDRHENLLIETSGDYSDEGIENIPVQRANLPEEARECIFYKNALELLKRS